MRGPMDDLDHITPLRVQPVRSQLQRGNPKVSRDDTNLSTSFPSASFQSDLSAFRPVELIKSDDEFRDIGRENLTPGPVFIPDENKRRNFVQRTITKQSFASDFLSASQRMVNEKSDAINYDSFPDTSGASQEGILESLDENFWKTFSLGQYQPDLTGSHSPLYTRHGAELDGFPSGNAFSSHIPSGDNVFSDLADVEGVMGHGDPLFSRGKMSFGSFAYGNTNHNNSHDCALNNYQSSSVTRKTEVDAFSQPLKAEPLQWQSSDRANQAASLGASNQSQIPYDSQCSNRGSEMYSNASYAPKLPAVNRSESFGVVDDNSRAYSAVNPLAPEFLPSHHVAPSYANNSSLYGNSEEDFEGRMGLLYSFPSPYEPLSAVGFKPSCHEMQPRPQSKEYGNSPPYQSSAIPLYNPSLRSDFVSQGIEWVPPRGDRIRMGKGDGIMAGQRLNNASQQMMSRSMDTLYSRSEKNASWHPQGMLPLSASNSRPGSQSTSPNRERRGIGSARVATKRREELVESPVSKAALRDFSQQLRNAEKISPVAAKEYAEESLKWIPANAKWRVALELAEIARRGNDFSQAREYFKLSASLQPLAGQNWLEWSKMEEDCGDIDGSLRILREGLARGSFHEGLLTRALKLLERQHGLQEARGILSVLKYESIDRVWRAVLEGALLEARTGRADVARRFFKYLMAHVICIRFLSFICLSFK